MAGLAIGEHMPVDDTFARESANNDSRVPREQIAEAAQIKDRVRKYPKCLTELGQENGDGEQVHQ
jgi:hypothetical protein